MYSYTPYNTAYLCRSVAKETQEFSSWYFHCVRDSACQTEKLRTGFMLEDYVQ